MQTMTPSIAPRVSKMTADLHGETIFSLVLYGAVDRLTTNEVRIGFH